MAIEQLANYINGTWQQSHASTYLDVRNPATAETLVHVPVTPRDEVDAAAQAAQAAWDGWRRTPATERIQYLFRLKNLLEESYKDIARTLTQECGKTLAEAEAEMRRGIENVEVACGIPMLMQGYNNEDIASGIDEHLFRQPLGVVAAITPFNFPGMIALPDADMEMTTRIVADSSFGCAGQRCLASSVAITVGEARDMFRESIAEAAARRKVGYGLDPDVEMGPVITAESKQR